MATESRTLHVRIADTERTRDEMQDKLAALGRGDDVDDMLVLNLASYADLARLTRETNMNIIHALVTHDPASIREVAELVGRDYKEVHRNLSELETLGVVTFETQGRSKRPVVQFKNIEIQVDFDKTVATESRLD